MKSNQKEPENSCDTQDLLKKEIEAEMRKEEKEERRLNRFVIMGTSSGFGRSNKQVLKYVEDLTKRSS